MARPSASRVADVVLGVILAVATLGFALSMGSLLVTALPPFVAIMTGIIVGWALGKTFGHHAVELILGR